MELHLCERIQDNISRVIVGKTHAIELILVAILADGHVLIEDIPGLGKTLLAKALAKSIAARSVGFNLRRTCCPRTSPDSMSITSKRGNSSFNRAR